MTTTHTPISSAANIIFHTRLKLLLSPSSSRSPLVSVKCSNPSSINGFSDTKSSKLTKNGGLNNELLNGDRNRVLINGSDKATQTVGLAETEKQETRDRKMIKYVSQLETRVSEIAETEIESKTTNKYEEKLESVKAAVISAIVGTLASLPISLIHFTDTYGLTVSTSIVIVTCALYGATYRYTIRRDFDDIHLKTGTSAAFGIIKGVATLDGHLSLDAFSGVVCVAENVLIFVLAAAGLDICYKMGILSPYPLERSISRTKM